MEDTRSNRLSREKLTWIWCELALCEFSQATFEDMSARFRGPNPICLLSRLKTYPDVTVANILSPLGMIFWGSPQPSTLWSNSELFGSTPLEVTAVAQIKHEFKASHVGLRETLHNPRSGVSKA